MNDIKTAPASQTAKDTDVSFQQWLVELGEALSWYQQARSEWEHKVSRVRQEQHDADVWKKAMDERLRDVVARMRGRLGHEVFGGLEALASASDPAAESSAQEIDWDPDDRVTIVSDLDDDG